MGDKLGLEPSSRLTNVVGLMLHTCACVHIVGLGTRRPFFLVELSKNSFLKEKCFFWAWHFSGRGTFFLVESSNNNFCKKYFFLGVALFWTWYFFFSRVIK